MDSVDCDRAYVVALYWTLITSYFRGASLVLTGIVLTGCSKTHKKCHPEVVPVLHDRRICFAFSTRKQQILRYAQDDTRGEQFFSSLLVPFQG